ncbi:uncharacterized protein BCR38DRAFT_409237 [Pseudomassariella vexata]|uniref:AA1-like domain-containing protein n=1 Tax=Pseudomassariella vexata TaxID=1141098 RepID=A0A1Y2E1Y3_9PEZI|nr:uncharacterized protein BCR38DRAFT_409237 [Pseudomassariella vexata]ORY65550.1 hypothetical protein BCR38DRAFT_409237 [Pseudomassariella vexata]
MRSSTFISMVAAFAGAAVASPVTRAADYGSWNVTVSGSSAASGYRWEEVTFTYSLTNTTSSCDWLYDPTVHAEKTTCDDPTLSYTWSDFSKSSITVHQTVNDVALSGSAAISVATGLYGSGRGWAGNTIVEASPA